MSDEKRVIHEPKIVVKSFAQKKNDVEFEAKNVSFPEQGGLVYDPNKKTILYVVTKANWGGAQKYVYDLASHFRHEYNVAVAFGKNEFAGNNIFKEKLEDIGVHVYSIESFAKKVVLTREIGALYNIGKLLFEVRPDILHLNSPKAGGLGGLVGRFLSVNNIVYTVHGLNMFEDRPAREIVVINMLSKLIMSLSHQIITISQVEKTILRSWGFGKKVHLVYNGLHPVEYADMNEKLKAIIADAPEEIAHKMRQEETIIIGSIAEMTANKGIFYTLEALVELKKKNIPFVYIHYGTGDQEKLLSLEVEQFGLSDCVLFKGFDKLAANYLPMFDIFTLPSIKEGLPYVLLEAAGAGKAVIASRVGGIPEIIKDGETGILITPKNIEELVSAIEKLALDPSLRAQYGEALKKHTQESFSLKKMYELTEEVYTA